MRLRIPRRLLLGPPPPLSLKVRRDSFALEPGKVIHRGRFFPYTLHRPRRDALLVCWKGLGRYLIEQRGRSIAAWSAPGAGRGEFRDLLLTTIASFALLERRLEPLHASCVGWGGRAIAFPGRAGSGKSTLAAFFVRRGAELLADDLLPLRSAGRNVLAYSSVPEIKLDAAAARALGLPRGLARVSPRNGKRIWAVQAARGPRPLGAIYLPRLSRTATRPRLTPLSYAQAFPALLRFNFNPQLQTRQRLQRQFALFAQVAESVPARRVIIPRGWKNLEAVAERVEADLESLRR